MYRFSSEKRIKELADDGSVRMWCADFYSKLEKDVARQDDEMSKVSFLNGKHATVTTMDGRQISVLGDIRSAHSGPPYYLLCLSCEWDQRLYNEFRVDQCAVVTNVDEFAHRLETAASALAPGWLFYHNPVEYFDPYEIPPRSLVQHNNSKDFRFAYQREYRFLLMRAEAGPTAEKYLDVTMGPMRDCLELWPR